MRIYTGGTFDLFHAGHVELLSACRQLARAGQVIVALNRDAFVASYKGKPPVCTYAERQSVLLACRYVDSVVPNDGGRDSKPTIEMVGPDVIAVGRDWAEKDYLRQLGIPDRGWLAGRGILLTYLETHVITTTEIKRRVIEGPGDQPL